MGRTKYARLILGAYVDDRFQRAIEATQTPIPTSGSDYVRTRVLESNQETPWAEGQPIFPEMETMESLEDSKEDSGPDFVTQMLNIPSGSQNRRFQREDCVGYKMRLDSENRPEALILGSVEFPYQTLYRTLTVDPTGGMSKECDAAAIIVTGWAKSHAQAFVLDYWHERTDPKTQIEATLRLAKKWDVKVISPEHVAYQVTYQFWLQDMMTKMG